MKTCLLLACCLLLTLARPARSFAQTLAANSPDLVVVRLFDSGGSVRLVITRGNGQSEVLKFDSGQSERSLTKTSEGYYQVFARLYGEGYVLQSTFSSGVNTNNSFTTMLFVKGR